MGRQATGARPIPVADEVVDGLQPGDNEPEGRHHAPDEGRERLTCSGRFRDASGSERIEEWTSRCDKRKSRGTTEPRPGHGSVPARARWCSG